ncbi:390_t:CDS:2 [Paraglomus brasilianum]|uniref:390_t:CDS:1 n=1 Tax=Paraglomus brasilianum TaxID=144538 RepID=A0A9N9DDL8_9GLOM|nr:390_t:CDS:2 [Paraglomus brasilianum]
MSNAPELSNVRDFLKKVNLLEYYGRFVAEGFDDLTSIMEVTEADLEAMDVKRGHRRRLQREIATVKGYPHITSLSSIVGTDSLTNNPAFSNDNSQIQNIPLQSKQLYVNETSLNNQIQPVSLPKRQETQANGPPPKPPEPTSSKRKYRRHPKRDRHAPVKPASAYVMFAHRVREQYQGQNLSFPEMAKIVGERWKNVPSAEKEAIEKDAAAAKSKYLAELEIYKNSDAWKQYQIYLRQFYDNDNGKPDRDRKRAHTLRFKSERFPGPEHSTSTNFPATQATPINYQSNIPNNECNVLNNRSNSIFSYQAANCNQHKECTNFHPDGSHNGRRKDSSNNLNTNASASTPTSDSTISSNGSASTTITTATTSTTSTTSTMPSMFQSRRTNDSRGN